MNKAAIRQLIAENRLEEAIRELLTLTRNTHFEQDVLLLSSRYSEYKSVQIKGIESSDDLGLRRNQITHALLTVVEQLPDSAPTGSGVLPPTGSPVFSGTGDGKGFPSTGTGDGRLPSKMPFWFSIGAFAVLLAISLFVPGWAQQNNALFKTLLALAAAGVAATLPGFLNFEINNFLKAGGALAAFALVFLVNPAKEEVPSILTVQIRSLSPSANYPPLKVEKLEIWNKNDWLPAQFPKEGVADFKNFSPEIIGKKVALRCKPEFYKLVKDSLLISPPAVALDFVPDGSLAKVNGSVQDSKGRSLSGAVVRVEGIADTTDAFGLFQLSIPPEKQREKYRLIASKTGYDTWENFFSPTAGQEAPIVLMKSKK